MTKQNDNAHYFLTMNKNIKIPNKLKSISNYDGNKWTLFLAMKSN